MEALENSEEINNMISTHDIVTNNAVVETIGLSKKYGRQQAVNDFNMRVTRGQVYGLLGPNGAGKTTILKMLTGLLRPTTGEVRLFGELWRRKHLSRVGALIETAALYGHLNGPENLEVHTRLLGLPKSRIDEVLQRVDLTHAGRKKVEAYSLGMKQRLGIAVALLDHPELLILDEPTNGLDPAGILEMRSLIRSFSEKGITVIVSSHILAEVAQVVSHVGIVSRGEVRYQGSLEDLMAEGEGYLEIRTSQGETALKLLQNRFPDVRLQEDGKLAVPIAEENAAGLLGQLNQKGILVEGMNYHRDDLESLFMWLTDVSASKNSGEPNE